MCPCQHHHSVYRQSCRKDFLDVLWRMTILKSENSDSLAWLKFKFKVLLCSSCFSAWLPKDRDVSAPSPGFHQ